MLINTKKRYILLTLIVSYVKDTIELFISVYNQTASHVNANKMAALDVCGIEVDFFFEFGTYNAGHNCLFVDRTAIRSTLTQLSKKANVQYTLFLVCVIPIFNE